MVVKSKENEAMMKLAYKYYVVNSDNRIVCGFPTVEKMVFSSTGYIKTENG